MLFQNPTEQIDWIKTIVLVVVPFGGAFAFIGGAIGYFGKRFFERKSINLADSLKELELEEKRKAIEAKAEERIAKKDAEIGQLADRINNYIEFIGKQSDLLVNKDKEIIENERKCAENDRKHADAMEKAQGEILALAEELANEREHSADEQKINERRREVVKALMNEAKIAFWITDGSGKQIYVNDFFYELFDTTAGHPDAWKERLVQGDYDRITKEWMRFINDKDSISAIRFRRVALDGSAVDCMSVYKLIRDNGGEVIEVWGLTLELK